MNLTRNKNLSTEYALALLKANNRNDDPAGVRWINSDLIGFTYRMKKIKAEVDTT